jgi:hypothetical protein
VPSYKDLAASVGILKSELARPIQSWLKNSAAIVCNVVLLWAS